MINILIALVILLITWLSLQNRNCIQVCNKIQEETCYHMCPLDRSTRWILLGSSTPNLRRHLLPATNPAEADRNLLPAANPEEAGVLHLYGGIRRVLQPSPRTPPVRLDCQRCRGICACHQKASRILTLRSSLRHLRQQILIAPGQGFRMVLEKKRNILMVL